MPAVSTHLLKDTSNRIGFWRSWWLPGSPIDGELWARKDRLEGSLFSTGHRRSPDGKYREGGPFYSLKFRTENIRSAPIDVHRKDAGTAYSGSFAVDGLAWFYDYSFMAMRGYDTQTITSRVFVYGAEAFHALKPDKPDFSPLLSIVELVRELPTIWAAFREFNKRYYRELARKKEAGVFLSRTGKYHLAIQFGVMPIISDVLNFIEALDGADKRVAQLLRDNGKWVRRRRLLSRDGYSPDGKSLAPPNLGWSYTSPDPWINEVKPGVNYRCYPPESRGHLQNSYQISSRTWAVGKSKYYLPGYEGSERDLKSLKRKVYANMKVTPALVYNLVPWSWLLDYFSSFGSLFDALSTGLSDDQVVFQYAYVMREEIHTDICTYTQSVYTSNTSTESVTCQLVREGTLRVRIEASLFGFGLTPEDLSPMQVGILGALGLSRL